MKFEDLEAKFQKVWRTSGPDGLFKKYSLVETASSTMDLARLHLAKTPRSNAQPASTNTEGSTNLIVDCRNFSAAIFALSQTAGRGRDDRVWHSEAATGIYVTYAWNFCDPIPKTEALSLAAGIAVYRFCRELGVESVGLKWPNDVLVKTEEGYRKLAGVLTECSTRGTSNLEVYLGIGLNLAQMSFPESVPGVSILQILGSAPDYPEACASLSQKVHAVMDEFFAFGFATLLPEYNRGSLMNDARVSVPGESVKFRACSVNIDGGLRCIAEDSGVEQVLYRADIELADLPSFHGENPQ